MGQLLRAWRKPFASRSALEFCRIKRVNTSLEQPASIIRQIGIAYQEVLLEGTFDASYRWRVGSPKDFAV